MAAEGYAQVTVRRLSDGCFQVTYEDAQGAQLQRMYAADDKPAAMAEALHRVGQVFGAAPVYTGSKNDAAARIRESWLAGYAYGAQHGLPGRDSTRSIETDTGEALDYWLFGIKRPAGMSDDTLRGILRNRAFAEIIELIKAWKS